MTSLSTDITGPARKLGIDSDGNSLRSIGHIGRLQRFLNKDAEYVTPLDMLAELRDDNKQLGPPAQDAWPFATSREMLSV
jgi:starvation-inducible DNA-binding protein